MKLNKSMLLTFAALMAAATGSAQTTSRQATMIAAENPNEGRCTVSVLVNGAADVEIRGDNAVLRRVAGPAPQLQRFECTGPLPYSASNLQLRAIEGVGRMTLTYDSAHGGAAVVRISNPDTIGDEFYTFDVFWRRDRVYQSSDADRLILNDDSIQSCRTAAESRIRNDGYRNVRFGQLSMDTSGADDLVTGTASATNTNGSGAFSFSCRVDPSDSQVRRLELTRR